MTFWQIFVEEHCISKTLYSFAPTLPSVGMSCLLFGTVQVALASKIDISLKIEICARKKRMKNEGRKEEGKKSRK